MAVYKRFSPNLLSAFWLVIMVAIWLAFAPKQAGGSASYIVIIGNSMEPDFHIGDLVIAHAEPTYQVGDAVVYRNVELERFVFHRIIAQEMGRLVLQGDNNFWIDTYHPTHEEVVGKLWLHIPRGGQTIQKLRSPLAISLIAGILAVNFAITLIQGKSKGNKRMNKKSFQEWFASMKNRAQGWLETAKSSRPTRRSNAHEAGLLEGSFFSLGLVAFASLILLIISLSRPAYRNEVNDIGFNHLGFFSYSGSAPEGVYDANNLSSGDPIFPRLTCSVGVNFQYVLMAQQAENLAGTYRVIAVVSEAASGWKRRLPLQNVTLFSGNTFGTTASLNVCQIETLIQDMEQETDFHSASYFLTITPDITLTGNISGRPLEGNFSPGLNFRYDRVHFSLVKDEETGSPLEVTEIGSLHEERTVPNTMLLLGMKAEIPALRWITMLGLIASLAGMALLAMRVQNLSRNDQGEFIRLRYQSLVIEIHDAAAIHSTGVIDVAAIDDLAKLAEKSNSMILHATVEDQHIYYVQGTGSTYRVVMPKKMSQPEVDSSIGDRALSWQEALEEGNH